MATTMQGSVVRLSTGAVFVGWGGIDVDEVEGVGACALVLFAVGKASPFIGIGINPNLALRFEFEMAEFEGGACVGAEDRVAGPVGFKWEGSTFDGGEWVDRTGVGYKGVLVVVAKRKQLAV